MSLLDRLIRKTEKIDFKFPNDYNQLMNNKYYDYEKFEMFLLHVFKIDKADVQRISEKGKGDGGADLIVTKHENGLKHRIGIQAKYWKNRVGVGPVRQLSNTNIMLGLDDLWIITTSDLTADAQREAEKLNIKVLRKEDVIEFIEFVKRYHEKEMKEKGESSIEFLPIDKKPEIKKQTKKEKPRVVNDEYENLRKLRQDLSRKHKLGAVYLVFNNESLDDLLKIRPKTLDELLKVKGFGPVKVEQFGEDIINFFSEKVPEISPDQKFREFLQEQRIRISKYNKMSIEEVYNDTVLENIITMKPRNISTLEKVFGFKKENIEIFGDYLVRQIDNYFKA